MNGARTALLADRGVIRIDGDDASKLLQGIITGDVDLLSRQPAIYSALLTPQGKLLFEFFVVKDKDGFLLETGRDQVAALVKRLTMYKLRAKVDIRDVSEAYAVLVAWGSQPQGAADIRGGIFYPDPRVTSLGWRVLTETGAASGIAAAIGGTDAGADGYDAHRIALGVPTAGKDYALGDTFPHEANFDLLNGVSFAKGCFVGQEVVSRMQHRGTARKRIVIVEAEGPLQPGAETLAGEAAIGTIGSVAGNVGLALLRLDRAEEAEAKKQPLTAGGVAITFRRPAYMLDQPRAVTP